LSSSLLLPTSLAFVAVPKYLSPEEQAKQTALAAIEEEARR
jgi:hypothetical protein